MGVTVKSRSQSRAARPPVRKLRIGLVNNMGDAALACTERQFASLLASADGVQNFELIRFTLATAPRSGTGRTYLDENSYRPAGEIADAGLDGVIVTGSEPKASDLRAEPYWNELAAFFDWIEAAGPPAIFSCLATHAAVLHFDGIERRRLAQKRFGFFEHVALGEHALTRGLPRSWRVAHSRWHELAPDSLAGPDYKILTFAPGAGVGLFVRERRNLLTFFQGHPEYDSQALAREYKRDVKRFLRRESELYPRVPKNVFDAATCDWLWKFELRAKLARDIALIEEFPEVATTSVEEKNKAAISVYRAWLAHLRDHQTALLPEARELVA